MRKTLIVLAGLLTVAGPAAAFSVSGYGGQSQFVELPGSTNPFWCDGAGCVAAGAGYYYFAFVDESTGDAVGCLAVGATAAHFDYAPFTVNGAYVSPFVCFTFDAATNSLTVYAVDYEVHEVDALGIPLSVSVQTVDATAGPSGANAVVDAPFAGNDVDATASSGLAPGTNCVEVDVVTTFGPASLGPFCL